MEDRPIGMPDPEQYPDFKLDRFKELGNRFAYHAPNSNQIERYQELRGKAHELAMGVMIMCPESREKSLALTKIEEAVMWANASIARNE